MVLLSDPLTPWWVHTAGVHRLTGSGASGDVFAPAEIDAPDGMLGFYLDGTELVTVASGDQETASGRFAFPIGADPVPVGSYFTKPDRFGGARCKVIKAAIGDGGGRPTPDHQQIWVQ